MVGRPKKYYDTKKIYSWFDEDAYTRAKKDYDKWCEAKKELRDEIGFDFNNQTELEDELRKKHPELSMLDIEQLYKIEGILKDNIDFAFHKFSRFGKNPPSLDKEDFTVKVPVELAEEYSFILKNAKIKN